MSVLENFKNIPRSPYGGRQGSNVIFFSSNLQRSPWREKKRGACRPPNGRQAPVAHPRGDRTVGPPGGPVAPPAGDRGGACRPPHGRPGQAAYIRPPPHSLLSFDLKKSRKKRGVRRREAAKLCRIPHLWSTGNFRINSLILYNNLI